MTDGGGSGCPDGMVLDDGLCKTPSVESVAELLRCAQVGFDLVSSEGEPGTSVSCQKAVDPHCAEGKVLHEGMCRTATVSAVTLVELGVWVCAEGVLETVTDENGTTRRCVVAVVPPTCPAGEMYRPGPAGCYTSASVRLTAPYEHYCVGGAAPGHSGEAYVCTTAVSPYCSGSLVYRQGACYSTASVYATAPYEYYCVGGAALGHSGEGYVCTTAVSPYCSGSLVYRQGACYSTASVYATAPYEYSCASGYDLGHGGEGYVCSKTETYQHRVCSFDPIAGQQCWYETRTRTVTADPVKECPSGYSANGANCRADAPTTEYTLSSVAPVTSTTSPAPRRCPSGYSANGANCRADAPTTEYTLSSVAPVTSATSPAPRRCPSGYSANGANCRADAPTTEYTLSSVPPVTSATSPAPRRCPSGYSANGANCRADTATTEYTLTASTPVTSATSPAPRRCPSGYSANGANCRADTATTEYTLTASTPVTERDGPAPVRLPCTEGYEWSAVHERCEKPGEITTYSHATAPLVAVVGDAPVRSCPESYEAAGGGRCERTVLGEPIVLPPGDSCASDLGTLGAAAVTRSGSWAAECVSGRRGNAQAPHYARRYLVRVGADSTLTVAVSSTVDPFVYLVDADGTEVGSDNDSGTGRDAMLTGIAADAGTSYVIEATTAEPRRAGAFTVTATAAAVEPPVVISGLSSGTAYGSTAAVTAADSFTVEPDTATCTAVAVPAAPAPRVVVGSGGARTVSVTAAAPFSSRVTVACDAPARTAAEAATTLTGHIAVSTLTLTAGTSCTPSSGATDYRCTIARGTAVAVTAAAQGAHPGLGIAWAATGGATAAAPNHTAVTPVEPAGFARSSTAAVSCTAEGTVTVTATAAGSTKTATAAVECPGEITITGLEDRTVAGTGVVTVAQPFTVAPAAAACTAAGAAGNPAVTDGNSPADRTVTARLAAGTAAAVTVTCAYPGLADAAATATLTARETPRVTAVAVTSSPADACDTSGDTAPAGVDALIDCDVPHSGAVAVTVTADANVNGPSLGWNTTGDATVARSGQSQRAAPLIAPDGSVAGWRRVGTAQIACSRVGTDVGNANLTVSAPDAAAYLARLAVDCTRPIQISGLTDTTATGTGTGTVTVTRTFAVDPAAAACTAAAQVGTAAVAAGTAGARTLSAGVASGTTADVTVTCTHPGRSDAAAAVKLTARAADACEDFIGVLPVGLTARAGTIAADAGCVSAQRRENLNGRVYYARRHTFTLDAAATVTATHASAASAPRLDDPYLLLLAGHGTSGEVIDTDDDSGPGRAAQITAILDPGSYTLEATAFGTRRTGSYTLAVDSAAVAGCTTALGTLTAGQTTRNGGIERDSDCPSQQRIRSSRTPNYAHWHTFALTQPAWIDIDLARPTGSGLNPYVILSRGHTRTGTVIGQDDDTGPGLDARLRDIHLPPGDYTIETTSHSANDTGTYTLTLTIPISGLPDTINATIDEQTTVNFTYWPTTARNATAVASTLTALDTAASASNGAGSVTVLPHLVLEHQVTLSLAVPASGGTRSTRSVPASVELVEYEFEVVSVCPEGETAGSAGGVLCGRVKTQNVEPSYKVTPGTLIGVRKAVRDSLLEGFANPFWSCGVTENQIIALLLSIGYREVPIHDDNVYNRFVARSPMGLSRKDMNRLAFWPEGDISRLDDARTTSGGFVLAPRRIASQAFWHAGAGLWQLDDPSGLYTDLNHAERISTTEGGSRVADYWRDALCQVAPAELDAQIRRAYGPWLGCAFDRDEDGTIESYPCFDVDYEEIYTPRLGSTSPDGLNVSPDAFENARDYDVAGGTPSRSCRWGTSGAEIGCWFVNTAAPQGRISDYDPAADFSDSWKYVVNKKDPSKTGWYRTRSPLAVPFLSFTDAEHRFAVFPKSILAARAAGLGSTAYTMIKRVPLDMNVRDSRTHTPWERDSHNGSVLHVEFCGEPSGITTNDVACEWISVNSVGFAARMGVSARGS